MRGERDWSSLPGVTAGVEKVESMLEVAVLVGSIGAAGLGREVSPGA